ncbi:MAG: hypothetical protein U0802_08045 [Candidatus Binatia bacterium]
MGRAARRKQGEAPVAVKPAPRSPSPPRAATPAWVAALLGPACIVLLGGLAYANSFAIPFLFDDYLEIQINPHVKTLQPLGSYLTALRGLPRLTFALNVQQGGYDVWGFHLVNVALHLTNALLVYALVLWTLRLPFFAGRYAPRARLLATLVALVFVLHPLQTMVASYLVQRAEGMGGFFYLATLLCAAHAFTADGARRALLVAGAVLAAALGISKEIVATRRLPSACTGTASCAAGGEAARRPGGGGCCSWRCWRCRWRTGWCWRAPISSPRPRPARRRDRARGCSFPPPASGSKASARGST